MKIIMKFPSVSVLPSEMENGRTIMYILPLYQWGGYIGYDAYQALNKNNEPFICESGFHFNNETTALTVRLDTHKHDNVVDDMLIVLNNMAFFETYIYEFFDKQSSDHIPLIRWGIIERLVKSNITFIDDFGRARHYVGLQQIIDALLADPFLQNYRKHHTRRMQKTIRHLLSQWEGLAKLVLPKNKQSTNEVDLLSHLAQYEQNLVLAQQVLERETLTNKGLVYTLSEQQALIKQIISWGEPYSLWITHSPLFWHKPNARMCGRKRWRRRYPTRRGVIKFYVKSTTILHDTQYWGREYHPVSQWANYENFGNESIHDYIDEDDPKFAYLSHLFETQPRVASLKNNDEMMEEWQTYLDEVEHECELMAQCSKVFKSANRILRLQRRYQMNIDRQYTGRIERSWKSHRHSQYCKSKKLRFDK